jgi:UDP-N-acetylmuramoylalanine--D-glutamate ligase
LVARAFRAVIGVDDDYCRKIADRLEKAGNSVIRVSVERPLAEGVYLEGSNLILTARGHKGVLASLGGIGSLRGAHNAQNAACAIMAAGGVNVPPEHITAALKTFPGLAHRMEEIGHKGKVLFVNDSKATNADSTEKALSSFAGAIFWILGGKAKDGGITSLKAFFPKIAKAYLIGEASEAFAAVLDGQVPHVQCGTLEVAVSKAAEDAMRSKDAQPVVLLSPACASFDQFPNFEIRGERFRELVRAIPGVEPMREAAA